MKPLLEFKKCVDACELAPDERAAIHEWLYDDVECLSAAQLKVLNTIFKPSREQTLKRECGEFVAKYSDGEMQAVFARKGYILEPIENWLDLYEEGKT